MPKNGFTGQLIPCDVKSIFTQLVRQAMSSVEQNNEGIKHQAFKESAVI